MGIFGALTTAVGGLRAQSFALENVSGQHRQLADHRVQARRHLRSSISSRRPAPTAQLAGGVTTQSPLHQHGAGRRAGGLGRDLHGDQRRTASSRCRSPATSPTTRRSFDGVDRYTRRGDFQLDKNGYLVNGAGYYLMGVPIDPTTGNPSGSVAAGSAIPERLPAGAADHLGSTIAPTSPAIR